MQETSESRDSPEFVAAVDLGSNSFHMIVARISDGELKIMDRIREMVRLAAGLNRQQKIGQEAARRAISCLERFGQRLRDVPSGKIRAVGTNTLRKARNAESFLVRAERALGHPIEIVSGVEEARLIYLGVAHSIADDGQRRLVIDIGGGSTELIIGERFDPLRMESLYMGCVNHTSEYFPDGVINKRSIHAARIAAAMELEPVASSYLDLGWSEAVGASGTIRAVEHVLREADRVREGISITSLEWLIERLVACGHIDKLEIPGLDRDRAPVFPGGVIVLEAVFRTLGLTNLHVSDGALREGLLYDLLGRIRHEDVRDRSVSALARRHHVDEAHASRIKSTSLECLAQVASAWNLDMDRDAQWLEWAARLHEVGLVIAHSQYHKHGAYLVENTDLPGFSRQEQQILSLLVRAHRRKFPAAILSGVNMANSCWLGRLMILLRLSVLLHRSRASTPLPQFRLHAGKKLLRISFPEGWLEQHPLTVADIQQEAHWLHAGGYTLLLE